MKRATAVILSKMLALVAVMFISTSSLLLFHRPEIPAELKK